jgi:hypothetical protein
MATLRLDVDFETYERLVEAAVSERRPITWQAEVVLRRALGLPFPTGVESPDPDHRADHRAAVTASP